MWEGSHSDTFKARTGLYYGLEHLWEARVRDTFQKDIGAEDRHLSAALESRLSELWDGAHPRFDGQRKSLLVGLQPVWGARLG